MLLTEYALELADALAGAARRRGGLARATRRAAAATSRCDRPGFAQVLDAAVGGGRHPRLPRARTACGSASSPLSTSFAEVHRGLAVLREVAAG